MQEFEELYRTYYPQIYRYLLKLCQNEALAEEITQETFFKVLKGAEGFRGDCKFFVWMCQIAKNTFYSYVKKHGRSADFPEELPAEETNPETIAADKDMALRIHEILHMIEEPYREVFWMRTFGELSFREIADIHKKSESWARVDLPPCKNKDKGGTGMKYACNLIRDLLPLYHDGAASSESAQAVEEHLGMCSACREYSDKICGSDVLEQAAYDKELTKKAAASYQRVYRKLVRKIGKIIGITVIVVLLFILLLYAAVVGYLYISAESSREVHRDMESYGCLDDGRNVLEVFADGGKPEDGIWRETITDDMEVQDYLLVYYHPWDANYLGYLTVTYDKEAYAAEVARLLDYPSTEYLGNYGASGFSDYEVLAMQADDSGFVYALTDGKGTIIYVGMIFPGYSMGIEYEEYLPEEYLPEGLDIGEDNPTKQKKTERWAQ